MNLEDVLTKDERLDLWVEMMTLADAMQEYCDWFSALHRGQVPRTNLSGSDILQFSQ